MSYRALLEGGRGSPIALRLCLPLTAIALLAGIPLVATATGLGTWMQDFAAKVIGRIGENIVSLLTLPFDHTDKFFLLYFLLSFAIGAAVLAREPTEGEAGRRGLLQRLFPIAIYWHPSARIDYGIILVNRVLTPALLVTRLLSSAALSSWITLTLTDMLGPRAPLLSGSAALALFTLLFALTTDLADYAQHALHHRVRLLWEFHKLHHSAEVLTPLTTLRTHPMEQIVGSVVATLLLGPVTGMAGYWLMDSPQPVTFFGGHLLLLFFYSCCSVHLRHSHVWLSWSPALSHVLISPAQHQIHHSSAARHRNKNYGNVLALWDWLFGSLYVPRQRESFPLGLPEGQPHPTLIKAYLVPFAGAIGLIGAALGMQTQASAGKHE